MRLIDADKLKKKRFRMHSEFLGTVLVVAVKDIDDAPTINPERPKGEWIKRPDERICPFCKTRYSYFGGAERNFCAYCGADMRGDNNGC